MSHNETYERYWNALDPADPEVVRERILKDAYNDPEISGIEFKALLHRANPEVFS